MATRMTSARFVGRTAELAELQAALNDAADSRASLALVGGESGVGKSRLAEELSRHARESGARVLSGDCVELGEDELPYAPLLTALRPLVRDGDPALETLAPSLRAALDAILPGLGAGSPGAEAAQARVFEALLALLDALSDAAPVVLIIEDLHWADSSTRHFLRFLVRTICNERLLVLGTYRSDELHRRHPLRPLLAELASDPYSRLIELPRFTPQELAEQLEGILADPPDPELVERLYRRSEGNALFAEEILAAGLDGRGALPPTLRDALMLRVERLSPRAQELIRWLACQPSADHALVAAVAGLDPSELRDALREAVASHIVVTVDDESYGFRHALLREVVYDDLLPGERTDMHAALARALDDRIEAGEGGAHITAQAAYHWVSAGDQPQALAAAIRAALAAERVHAFGEAQALFERALALWERVPDPEQTAGIDQVDLLKRAALACDQAGDPARQEALLRRALELVGEDADPRAYALLLERVSQSLWSQHRQDESMEVLKHGLELLPAGEQSSERATLLSQLAKKRMLQSRVSETKELGEEALAAARASGNRAAEGRALNALGTMVGISGDPDAGVKMLREALEIARELGSAWDEGGAWVNIADVLHLAGRTREAVEVAREGLEAGAYPEWRTGEWFQLTIADCSFHLGEWDEAEAMMPAASRRHTGGTFLFWQLTRAMIALGRGTLTLADEALGTLDHALEGTTEPQFVGPYGMLSAELARQRGDIAKARAAVDDAIDRIEYCSDDTPRVTSVSTAGLRVEGDAAQLAHDRQDADAERVAKERAESLIERVRVASATGGPVEAAQAATAEAEYARVWEAVSGGARDGRAPSAASGEEAVSRGRGAAAASGEEDVSSGRAEGPASGEELASGDARDGWAGQPHGSAADLFAAAAARWDTLERPFPVAYARWREAEALMAARDRDGATRAATDALAIARRLGSAWLAEEVESLAARARLHLGEETPRAASAGRDDVEDPFGLTARERDVLTLVAAGATNREIGEQLHMAEKTASVHVSRILAKLNVRSRTEAAAVAHRQGLVPTP
jgi:ATP/maltotriose-dependent transcriptional regulator MalT